MEELCSPQGIWTSLPLALTHLRPCFSTGLLGPAPGGCTWKTHLEGTPGRCTWRTHLEDGRLEGASGRWPAGPAAGGRVVLVPVLVPLRGVAVVFPESLLASPQRSSSCQLSWKLKQPGPKTLVFPWGPSSHLPPPTLHSC